MARQELSSLKLTLALVAALALLPPVVVGLAALGSLVGLAGLQAAKRFRASTAEHRRATEFKRILEMQSQLSVDKKVVSIFSARACAENRRAKRLP